MNEPPDDQVGSQSGPAPHPAGPAPIPAPHAPAQRRPPAPVPTVHVTARHNGLVNAILFVLGMLAFAAVFAIGLIFGIGVMVAGSSMDEMVIRSMYRSGSGSKQVAILPVTGIIDGAAAEFVHAAADTVLKDRSIAAVVLRVDSPGGGVTPSDQIWYEVQRIRKAGKPVVASFGGVAASGGYYVACAADHIMAEETCITGSIGVIAQVFTMENLLDKVGIEPVTLVAQGSPQKSVANDIFRAWTDEDRQKILAMLDSAYDTFSRRVKDARATQIGGDSRLADVANGSIFTAGEALANGLVDSTGYLDDAIAKAESLAGITTGSAGVTKLHPPPTLLGGLMGQAQSAVGASSSSRLPSLDADSVRSFVSDLTSPRILYLMR